MFVGAYWSQRQESRDSAAGRLAEFLADLRDTSAGLGAWYSKASTKDATDMPVRVDRPSLASALRVNRRDADGKPLDDLGFRFAAWNGSDASISVTVGAFSQFVNNAVVLSWNPAPKGLGPEQWREILRTAIRAFDPDYGVVTSSEHLEGTGASHPWEAGWFTYRKGGEIEEHAFPSAPLRS